MYTQSGNKAVQRYVKSHYDSIMLKAKKGSRERYKQSAAALGLSLNAFIISAIEEKIERSGQTA